MRRPQALGPRCAIVIIAQLSEIPPLHLQGSFEADATAEIEPMPHELFAMRGSTPVMSLQS